MACLRSEREPRELDIMTEEGRAAADKAAAGGEDGREGGMTPENTDFHCSRCSVCCRSLREFGGMYDDLDDGTGTCRYLDQKAGLCTIYDRRPDKCRVREGYQTYGAGLSCEEYLRLTYEGCRKLRELRALKQRGEAGGETAPDSRAS